jgi:hypothetical protein
VWYRKALRTSPNTDESAVKSSTRLLIRFMDILL